MAAGKWAGGRERERQDDASHEQTLLFSSRLLPRLLACSSCWKAGWTCWTSWLMDPHCTPPINPPPTPAKTLDYFPAVTELKQLPTISTPLTTPPTILPGVPCKYRVLHVTRQTIPKSARWREASWTQLLNCAINHNTSRWNIRKKGILCVATEGNLSRNYFD